MFNRKDNPLEIPGKLKNAYARIFPIKIEADRETDFEFSLSMANSKVCKSKRRKFS